MPTVEHSTLSDSDLHNPKSYTMVVRMDDVSTAGSVYLATPYAGTVVKVSSVLAGAIATADAGITIRNSAAASMGTITIANSGSAAGDVDTVAPASNNTVTADDSISIATDGASTNTVPATFTVVIERS